MKLGLQRKTDLALRAVLVLAEGRERCKGSKLAERIGTSAQFISQVTSPLVRQGWVTSDPGPTGGYRLAVDLADFSLLQLIEAVEGPTVDDRCVMWGTPCPRAEPCALHDPWQRARDALLGELEATSLAAVAARREARA